MTISETVEALFSRYLSDLHEYRDDAESCMELAHYLIQEVGYTLSLKWSMDQGRLLIHQLDRAWKVFTTMFEDLANLRLEQGITEHETLPTAKWVRELCVQAEKTYNPAVRAIYAQFGWGIADSLRNPKQPYTLIPMDL